MEDKVHVLWYYVRQYCIMTVDRRPDRKSAPVGVTSIWSYLVATVPAPGCTCVRISWYHHADDVLVVLRL
jgi:hypothetical protein